MDETVEIDGETLIVERGPMRQPVVMGVNLDKIDISHEIEIMEKHYPGSAQRLQQMIKEKQYVD